MGDYNGEHVIGYRKLLSNNNWANVEHSMITGSCHCQGVNYEITAEIRGFQHCHCHTCRKIHGTVYGSSAATSRDGFRIVSGNDKISEYESSPARNAVFVRTVVRISTPTWPRNPTLSCSGWARWTKIPRSGRSVISG
ncbi:MAG: GFA family protein [Proteobacteria bacterium]|nr:GFA family protein [Pseudomonadota bacterium]